MSKFPCPICGDMQSAYYLDVHMYRDHEMGTGDGYDCQRDCFFCGKRMSNVDLGAENGEGVYSKHLRKCTAYAACCLAGSVVHDHRMS